MRLTLGFLVLIFVIACQKELTNEDVTGTPPTGTTGLIKMNIDGKPWVADKYAGGSLYSGAILISGISLDKKTFIIRIDDTIPGTYTLLTDGMDAAAYTDSMESVFTYTTNQGDPATTHGVVTIASIDKGNKTMSGTFSCNLFREVDGKSITITAGVFENISFETSTPVSNSTDTFRVKIGTSQWNPHSIAALSVGGTGQLMISTTNLTSTESFGLVFMNPDIVSGVYSFDGLGGDVTGIYNKPGAPEPFVSESGQLHIIEHNKTTKRIRGNFHFRAVPFPGPGTPVEMTEGYFSVKYF